MALLGCKLIIQFETVDLCLVQDAGVGWTAEVAFIRDQQFQMPFQGILGTAGFLDRFAVTFNRYYDWFEICAADERE